MKDINRASPGKPLIEEKPPENDSLIIGELQLLLAEKRTSMAAMRTGIAVFALPLSVLSILVTTSKYYEVAKVLHFLIPLLLLCAALVLLGGYLVIKAILRVHHQDELIYKIKKAHTKLAEFID